MKQQIAVIVFASIAAIIGSQSAFAQPPNLSGLWTYIWDGAEGGQCRSQLQLSSSGDGSTFTGHFSQVVATVNAARPCPNPSTTVNPSQFSGQVYESSRGVVMTMRQSDPNTMYLATFNGYVNFPSNNDIKGSWIDVAGSNAGGHYELVRATARPSSLPPRY